MKISEKLNGIIKGLAEAIRTAPTTNIRILLTLVLASGTAVKYWVSPADGWNPSWEWLLWIAGMAGLDVWQHNNKRKTSWSPEVHARAKQIQNGHGKGEDDEGELG